MSLRCDALSVHYGRVQALDGVSLTVAPGEIVTLIGANGAGKTTLLRTLSGLHHAAAGTVTFEETSLLGLPSDRVAGAGVAHVPEGRRVFSALTVEENLQVGAFRGRRDRVEVARRLAASFERFPILGERRDQLAGLLSGGQQQMLAVARALMAQPRLVMLDEPTLGLSPRAANEVLVSLRELADQGVAILLVEQNARAALAVADRGYVIERGVITLAGTATELASSSRVQEAFLGTSIEHSSMSADQER